MDHGRSRADVVSAVFTGDRIHTVLAQIPFFRRGYDRFPDEFLKFLVIGLLWKMEIEQDGPRVLAKRLGLSLCNSNIVANDVHCVLGRGTGNLGFSSGFDCLKHIIRKLGGGLPDDLDQGVVKILFQC